MKHLVHIVGSEGAPDECVMVVDAMPDDAALTKLLAKAEENGIEKARVSGICQIIPLMGAWVEITTHRLFVG